MKPKNKKGETEKLSNKKKLTYITSAITAILILAVSFFYFYPTRQSGQPKAAIIDELSSSQLAQSSRQSNQTFVEETKRRLYERFSIVDYYSDNATVNLYRNLALENYKMIIWRAHSALPSTSNPSSNYIAIFTAERYSSSYDSYLEDGQLVLCNITGDQNLYLGITPKFVEATDGSFKDTVIILMSCNGLKQGYYKTAETFVEKGARVFISWDGWIDPYDNDRGISLLLDYVIDGNSTIREAVQKIPVYSSMQGPSRLYYYPTTSEAADYRIPDYRGDSISGNARFAAVAFSRKMKN